MGAPSATSLALVDRTSDASIPDRMVTAICRLLFEVTRSLSDVAPACTVKFAAPLLRATTLMWAVASTGIDPSSQVTVYAVSEQPPSSEAAESMLKAAFSGRVSENTVLCAATLPTELTTNGSVNGAPPSPDTVVTPASSLTSAYSAGVTQLADAIVDCILSMLHWEKVE